jgi:hypothetical protein
MRIEEAENGMTEIDASPLPSAGAGSPGAGAGISSMNSAQNLHLRTLNCCCKGLFLTGPKEVGQEIGA